VPDEMHQNIIKEYGALKIKYPDCDKERIMVNWDVICKIIREIIEQDSKCEINPLDDYLRHTLKAFLIFI
jgi:hypothetical protein